MSDLLSKSFSEIPRFIRTAVNLIIAPKRTGIELSENSSGKDSKYKQAAIFFGVSLILTELVRLPLLPPETEMAKLILLDGGWKTFGFLLFALLLFSVLRLFKSKLDHADVIHLSAHYAGILLVLLHSIQLGYFALKSASDIKLATLKTPASDLWSYMINEVTPWLGDHLFVSASYALLTVCLILLLLWMSRCWAAYSSLSEHDHFF